MSERIQVLAQQIFGKSSIDECGLQEIKDLAERFPYFAPAQFLLLEKLKRENAPDYPAQLRKAVLYYHNPLEFEYFISSSRFETEMELEDSEPSLVISHELREEKSFTTTVLPEREIINDIPVENEPVNEFIDEANATETEVEGSVDKENPETEEKMAESIERVLQHEEEQIKGPGANTNELVFEPYHTVDYFASQGIKLSQEETPKDRFSKQLKSFTEWLKTMKRLPESEISKNVDPSSESKIQHLAEDSVHDANVVTEAMAEVWIKQGNMEKAIETFHKLSLLNPSKKAYFAGLIENLKHS